MDVGSPSSLEALPSALIQRNRAWKEAASGACALPARGNSETSRLNMGLSMTFRLTPALCIFVLAGCTSSEPRNVSYAPAPLVEAAAPGPMDMPPPPPAPAMAPALQGQAGPFPANGIATPAPPQGPAPVTSLEPAPVSASGPALYGQTGQMPSGEAASPAAALPPGATNCSTVDGVTLCDAPADAGIDDTGTDDAYNTN